MKKVIIIGLGGLLLLIGFSLIGPIMSRVEQPKYQVITSEQQIEIREYESMIVAQVTVSGTRKEAINKGFRILADYIFGNNSENGKIAMTAPVAQQSGQKIAMTAPVTQKPVNDEWSVHFVMPAQYNLETIPKPNEQAIVLKEVPAKKFAVIRFSGMSTSDNLTEHEEILRDYLLKNKIVVHPKPAYAFYNPPWTLPFLRRNEIMLEIKE